MKAPSRLVTLNLAAFLIISCPLLANSRRGATPVPADTSGSTPASKETVPPTPGSITIPGPLRSFLRMAGISQQISPQDVLPLLARNVVMEGYGWRGRTPKPTEYLLLLKGYLDHARELLALAGPQHTLRVSNCSDAQTLVATLGYRFRQACGPLASLEVVNPKKAFLTIDSGFPLTDLEQALRDGKPFVYPFPTSQAPVLFGPSAWTAAETARRKGNVAGNDVIDSLVRDPALARLYWALGRMDPTTSDSLRQTVGLEKLIPFAPALDFYGSLIDIRAGRVVVPGGASAESAWKSLAGASPKSPSDFITHLLGKDEGWLAAYFDTLSRVNSVQQAYFTEPHRLRGFYRALRGESALPSPVRPVFRPDPGMLLLAARLQFDPNGQPHIPGNLQVWREIVGNQRKSHFKIASLWAKRAGGLNKPDQLVAALFALSRANSRTGPLQLFLTLNEVDRGRSPKQRLNSRTVRLFAEDFSQFGDQYPIFSEFHALDNSSITRFLNIAEVINRIHDRQVRADAMGIFQANTGLWQILSRQGEIPRADWNHSWQRVINPFAHIESSPQLFDAARSSLGEVFRPVSQPQQITQDAIISWLAGPDQTTEDGQQVHEETASKIHTALDAQRLISLDALFALGDDLNQMSHGKPMPANLLQLAGQLRELRMPKPLFSGSERAEWSYGLSEYPHVQAEMATNLAKAVRSPRYRKDLAAARGQLVPFLRDTLVGLNYAFYQPPGAQVLYNAPLFVRSHDFSGETIIGSDQAWKTPMVFGRGLTASGGAHLVGSLADLPYVLAEVEQNFIVPQNVQALVWEDLAPTLLTNSVVPRWWSVTRNELHAVALYQQFGEELVQAAVQSETVRGQVMDILADRLLPQRLDQVEVALGAGRPQDAIPQLSPAETFSLGAEFRRRFASERSAWGKAGQELEELSERYPKEVSLERLSEDFGVPHPAMAETYACELLNVKPFPTFMGYSSRLLAESWESSNLYWARLADDMHYSPVMLNLLAPELTRRMLSKIFATDLEDRPALLRALRETGQEFLKSKPAASSLTGAALRYSY